MMNCLICVRNTCFASKAINRVINSCKDESKLKTTGDLRTNSKLLESERLWCLHLDQNKLPVSINSFLLRVRWAFIFILVIFTLPLLLLPLTFSTHWPSILTPAPPSPSALAIHSPRLICSPSCIISYPIPTPTKCHPIPISWFIINTPQISTGWIRWSFYWPVWGEAGRVILDWRWWGFGEG